MIQIQTIEQVIHSEPGFALLVQSISLISLTIWDQMIQMIVLMVLGFHPMVLVT
jgi:hypothetical protein